MEKEEDKQKNENRFWRLMAAVSFFLFLASIIFVFFYIEDGGSKITSIFKDAESGSKYIQDKIRDASQKEDKDCEDCETRPLDGVLVKGEADTYPVGIVVDNHIEARPSSGLSKAGLVYEAEVEGGITRYLAFFDSSVDTDKVGPVRSVRPYFADMAKELSAVLVHCGGSPAGLARISYNDLINLNEFYNETYFYRDNTRPSPHNLFISNGKFADFLDSRGLEEADFFSWRYKKEDNNKITNSKVVRIGFSDGYDVKWEYNNPENTYYRYLAGEKHIEEDGSEITSKNLVIQIVESEVLDEKLRLDLEVVGKGEAVICIDGICRTGEWRKNSIGARTRYYTEDEEARFNPGITWVEVVRESKKDQIDY